MSLNKCFEKILHTPNGSQGFWAMNPNKMEKMNRELQKWSRIDPQGIKKGMAMPEDLAALVRGEKKMGPGPGQSDPLFQPASGEVASL